MNKTQKLLDSASQFFPDGFLDYSREESVKRHVCWRPQTPVTHYSLAIHSLSTHRMICPYSVNRLATETSFTTLGMGTLVGHEHQALRVYLLI